MKIMEVMKDKILDLVAVAMVLIIAITLFAIGKTIWAVVALIWLIFSIKVLNPETMGGLVFFGILIRKCNSGPHFVPFFPHCRIKRRPKKRFKLDFAPRVVYSKKGEEGGEDAPKKQRMIIDCVVYAEFEQTFSAIRAIIERMVPTTEEELVAYTDGTMDSAFRLAIGGLDWEKATEDDGREEIQRVVLDRIKEPNSIFMLGGFNVENLELSIKIVDLESEDLKSMLTEPDKQRKQTEGAVHEAQRVLMETEVLGKIRAALIKAGFDEDKVDKIAFDAYELQVAKDLSKENGVDALKVIKLKTGDSVLASLAKGVVATEIGSGLLGGKKPKEELKKKEEKTEKKKKIDEMSDQEKIDAVLERK